jgi:hypothetical protein
MHPIKFGPGVLDIWVFHRENAVNKYLLMRTSEEKADRWFGGARFWQIPCAFTDANLTATESITKAVKELALELRSVWACERVYTIYNRRFDGIQIANPHFRQASRGEQH